MKKYKHKRTGIIVEQGVGNKNYYYAYKENEAVAKWIVEDSLDWEEIKEIKKYSLSDIQKAYSNAAPIDSPLYSKLIEELVKISIND